MAETVVDLALVSEPEADGLPAMFVLAVVLGAIVLSAVVTLALLASLQSA